MMDFLGSNLFDSKVFSTNEYSGQIKKVTH